MNLPSMGDKIQRLNEIYKSETGLESRLSLGGGEKEIWFYNFLKHGFTEDDLRAVILWLQFQIRIKKRTMACLKLNNLIGNLMGFESELAIIKHNKARAKKPPTNREKVLAMSGRPVEAPVTIKRGNQALAAVLAQLAKECGNV